jgi:ribonuclease E
VRRAALVVVAACSGREAPAPVAGAKIGPALTAALTAADALQVPWRCAAADGPGLADEQVTTGERRWRLAGHTLATDGDGVIGVIADAGGAAPATLAALGGLRARMKADLVIALGGMAATRGELDAVIAALADPARPLVMLPGDLEPAGALGEAAAAARQRGAVVLDGRLIQRIELGTATVALVPGAGAASRLVAGTEGCAYAADDVARVLAELAARPGLRVLASAEAPREGETGERALAAALACADARSADPTGAQDGANASGARDGASASGARDGANASGARDGASASGARDGASASGARDGATASGARDGANASGARDGANASGARAGASASGARDGASASGARDGASASGARDGANASGARDGANASGARDGASASGARDGAEGCAIDIALHGPTTTAASPAQRGNRDGKAVSLTPGTSDALPRLPAVTRTPSAGVLALRGRAWSWQPIADVK